MKTELVVALDYPAPVQAEKLMNEMAGLPLIYKIGLELFLSAGPVWVKSLCDQRFRIFLDLKFYDIPQTVAAAVAQASAMGVEFTTAHLSGGAQMFDRINQSPKILGVSVLTSFSEESWRSAATRVSDTPFEIKKSVLNFGQLSHSHSKIYGMVCSPQEIETVRLKFPDLFLLVPGIRPIGSPKNDQTRVMTPHEAAQAGASAIVVGRPITQSENPRKIVESILKEIQ